MSKLTFEQWARAREEWEGNPTATFDNIAKRYGVAVSTISRRAAKEGWLKSNQLAMINELASRKADSLVDSNGTALYDYQGNTLTHRNRSEELRAEVLARHRQEWAELEVYRRKALEAIKEASEKVIDWREAKAAAETATLSIRALFIKQQGEARAWMLNLTEEEEIVIKNPRGDI